MICGHQTFLAAYFYLPIAEVPLSLRGIQKILFKTSDDVKGFKLLPRRWVVERTFAWLGRFRRMSKDYEFHPETSESIVHLAMISIMVRRLTAAQTA